MYILIKKKEKRELENAQKSVNLGNCDLSLHAKSKHLI